MIKNFIKTALRNLWKTKGYSFLNIFGLAVGIAAASLIFLWVENQLSYNDNFANKKDIYVVKSKQTYDGATYVFESTPGPFAQSIEKEIPGIKHAVRISWNSPMLFSVGDNNIFQTGVYADGGIADVLSLEFLEGDRKTAFDQVNNIVLSETAAKKLFGNRPALGKTVKTNNSEPFIVAAVIKDLPKNSSYDFQWLIPFKKFEAGQEWLKNWGNNGLQTLVQIEENANVEQINRLMLDFVKNKTKGEVTFSQNYLYPMERWITYNQFDNSGIEKEGGIKNIRLFTFIAWVVLLIACINFMNLATARSEKRAKEVGMRKVVGASRKSLITQFLGESLVLAIISSLVATLLIYIFIRPFNTMIGQELQVNILAPSHLLFLATITLACGLFAGSYPAFFLSAFKPLSTIKGAKQKAGSGSLIRKGLVILQYTASVVLIICTIIIYQQIQHNKNRDLGFDKSQVLTTALQGDMATHLPLIKNQLLATGVVQEVGVSDMSILNINSNTSGFSWDGKDPNASILIGMLRADEGLIPALDLKLFDGRNFHKNFMGDSTSVVINEAFAKLIRKDGLVAGDIISYGEEKLTIAGVVKNFVYNNVYADPEPMLFLPMNKDNGIMTIKTKAGIDLPNAIQQIEKIIVKNNPGFPFDYKFLDDSFNNKFKDELFVQQLSSVFALMSIIISCLGLFGLAAYATEQRAKEISIRKVLGASVSGLIQMLNREFVILVAISCIIAFPIAWIIMSKWLTNYAHHIQISWTIFVISGLTATIIALLTISSQAFKAAVANPTKTLRDE
ncbi:ABC transporter permease [Sphingobacterium prati]|uniref:ABC transporter permease n=1 Tax=Sphingobacterium prati TaxID=2737006 RepID=UPI0015574979|nr:ABC transporter permease [Sphingobacterium prati]NPE45890.1 FtsX-like permease family protein [Sphingobacterium prati]